MTSVGTGDDLVARRGWAAVQDREHVSALLLLTVESQTSQQLPRAPKSALARPKQLAGCDERVEGQAPSLVRAPGTFRIPGTGSLVSSLTA